MKKNVGSIDKTIRIILGCAVIVLGIIFKSWWGVLGLIPLLTALFGVCPAYLPFGISTCKKETT
ncbi:hypothetical protein A2V82_10580 [candidate division KSB1 bacterium RBG_16_48_16]|nr:MAG: hypothetical protein A2V82_10580 [candidate division KSB1 bacterium RBG_16_48_16]